MILAQLVSAASRQAKPPTFARNTSIE